VVVLFERIAPPSELDATTERANDAGPQTEPADEHEENSKERIAVDNGSADDNNFDSVQSSSQET